ncbi:MAG TPA: SMI1/KNR4 family protein, partial [Polyangiaceae bacterium]|nr:SMI1/KNR4 family protein [Polyangiaceae bacterium]
FQSRGIRATFGRADPQSVVLLRAKLKLPRRYREFLLETDPIDVETRTPTEKVRLLPSARLLEEQCGYCLSETGEKREGPSPTGWRPSWVVVAHGTLLGDPYFLDTALPDAEGDCPVFTAMSGTEQWKPRLCASSFALFIRILALGMEVAEGFADDDLDMDDESVFREALGPQIRQYDPAALKAGHWT